MEWQSIETNISDNLGRTFALESQANVGGGCINTAMKISSVNETYFIKFNDIDKLAMFEAEAEGLRDMAAANGVRVPTPICTGTSGNQSYIVMEHIAMGGGNRAVMSEFGEQLAQMHQHTSTQFGWHRDNTIGSTTQVNQQDHDWVTFWQQWRLGYQLNLATRHGIGSRTIQRGEKLQQALTHFFSDYTPEPSILHGDLWSGNYGISEQGEPVIFDPATYFGDREADIAMTELFGGFDQTFYTAYQSVWPLDVGYKVRKTLYNLYHILNHYNLFGGGYGAQADGMIEQLLAEVG